MATSISTTSVIRFIFRCWDYGWLFLSRILDIIFQVCSFQVFTLTKKSPVKGVPVIPNGTWYAGHLHLMKHPDFRACLHRYSVEYADEHGRCTFYMGPTTPSLSVTRLSDVQLLLKATAHRTVFPVMQFHTQRFFGRNNLPTLTGNEWKTKRSIITKALHGKQFMKHNQIAIRVATETLVKQLKKKILEDSERSVKLDISQVMKMLTFDAFGHAALHVDFECCKNLQLSRIGKEFEFLSNELMRRITEDLLNPSSHIYCLPTQSNRRFQDAKTYVESYIGKLIKERRHLIKSQSDRNDQSKIPQDLLTSLIQATTSSSSSSSSDDDESNIKGGNNLVVVDEEKQEEEIIILLDHLKTLLFAGHDTTSVALTYTLYLLSQHPDVERKCLDEIQHKSTASSSFDYCDNLPYLEAVIMETLRLYPPVISTTRSLERDFELVQDDETTSTKTIHIPKGTYLYFPIWVIQRDENNFDDPLTFRPERWMMEDGNSSSTTSSSIDNNKRSMLLSFSAGGRSCAGEKFARQELKIALSILLNHFSFKAPDDYVLTPHRPGIVQLPKGGVPMYISLR